ncbi:MAG: CorA family divalent cation transporter [Acetobacteraceae bacterium]
MLYANSGTSARETLAPSHHPANDAIWIDLLNPTEDECSEAAHITGLRVPVRDDIAEIESSSRLSMEGEALYMNMPVAFRTPDGASTVVPLGFVLTPRRLMTVRFANLPSFETYAEQFCHSATAPGSAEVFIGLMEAIVERGCRRAGMGRRQSRRPVQGRVSRRGRNAAHGAGPGRR